MELRDRQKLKERAAERITEDATVNSVRLLSGSKWTDEHLKWLGVKHNIEDQFDFERNVFGAQTNREWRTTYANSERKLFIRSRDVANIFRNYSRRKSAETLRNAKCFEEPTCP